MVYGSFGPLMVIADWVTMAVVKRFKGLRRGSERRDRN
jgi:hypothetical protein